MGGRPPPRLLAGDTVEIDGRPDGTEKYTKLTIYTINMMDIGFISTLESLHAQRNTLDG